MVVPSGAERDWTLNAQLAEDCRVVGDLELSRVLVMDDAGYPWLVLVPRRAAATEIIDLDPSDRAALMDEIAQMSHALRRITQCEKLNVASLGNVVPQLHVHVVARFSSDAAWPRPVWGQASRRAYAPEALSQFCAELRAALSLRPVPLSRISSP
jgi:diadenosine tetraphosphate (Ap4A) HIT family hydrolase